MLNLLPRIIFVFVMLFSGCGYGPMFDENPLPMDNKTISSGLVLYQQNCIRCHGIKGKGDGVDAKTLPIKPADLTDLPLFPAGFIEYKIKTGSDTEYMPAWEGVLTQTEIQQIGHYLRSIKH